MSVIRKVRKVHASDPSAWAWSGLRKFQNVELVTSKIVERQQVEAQWSKNVRKQARQLRYCMIQAREYFAAAQAVSIATKPNLLYYGTMSLALAEILFKQSGDSSLDRARGEHRHHGLLMTAGPFPAEAGLPVAAGALRAIPMEVAGKRRGTFELWRRAVREHPLAGKVEVYLPSGGSTLGFDVVLSALDTDFPDFPSQGISLADSLASLPLMAEMMHDAGLSPQFVRGTVEVERHLGDQWSSHIHIIFHPNDKNAALLEQITVPPASINRMDFAEVGTGLKITLHSDYQERVSCPLPPAAMVSTEEWRMWTNTPSLNELGYLYVALFIAGNYARYYPDRWLADVERSTPLALAIEQLCALAEWRVPWLALCEMEETLFVNDV